MFRRISIIRTEGYSSVFFFLVAFGFSSGDSAFVALVFLLTSAFSVGSVCSPTCFLTLAFGAFFSSSSKTFTGTSLAEVLLLGLVTP